MFLVLVKNTKRNLFFMFMLLVVYPLDFDRLHACGNATFFWSGLIGKKCHTNVAHLNVDDISVDIEESR